MVQVNCINSQQGNCSSHKLNFLTPWKAQLGWYLAYLHLPATIKHGEKHESFCKFAEVMTKKNQKNKKQTDRPIHFTLLH